jgi:hypothetical protein
LFKQRTLDDPSEGLQRAITEKIQKIVIPGTIITALVTLLLWNLQVYSDNIGVSSIYSEEGDLYTVHSLI